MKTIRHSVIAMTVCCGVTATLWLGSALAADKKAEADMRWALNYCGKVVKDMERVRGQELSAGRINDALARWQPDYDRFLDYLKKAKDQDASVIASTTVYDRKSGQTFAQAYESCLTLDVEMQAFRQQLDQKNTAYQEKKAAESREWAADETRRQAIAAADDAIRGECAGFKGWAGSSGIDARIAAYEQQKKKAIATWAEVTQETLTVNLVTRPDSQGTDTTRTVGEWFGYCDAMMPAHLAQIRKNEAAHAAKEKQETEQRRAADARIRKEQAERFTALVAATGGDRKRVLQAKGFLPWWPRTADLRNAPVWKWEVNITHEPTRCETYQFSGDRLVKNFTEPGGCP